MVTIFSVPKSFKGHIEVIQTNALNSWVKLYPHCEIILFGDEDGIGEKAAQFGARHVEKVLRNEYGTPLLSDVFKKAKVLAKYDILCYVNADIILMTDFIKAVQSVSNFRRHFLITGRRWDIDLKHYIDFQHPDWENKLRTMAKREGKPRTLDWIEYFVFPRALFGDLPPFALGRAAFDNWLLWKADSLGATLIDASDVVMAIHQNHDYSHHPEGQKGVWEGPEAQHNRKLMGTWLHCFMISDAKYRLTHQGIKRNLTIEHISRRWQRVQIALIEKTRPIRHKTGLTAQNLKTVINLFKKASKKSFGED